MAEPMRGGAAPTGVEGRVAERAAGVGVGWTKLASAVAERIPTSRIERIWLFPPLRHEDREWGTAVFAVRESEARLGVHTGTYVLIVRGRERGQAHVSLEEVGSGPDEVLPEVMRGVQQRAGEVEPPAEIDPALWFPEDDATDGTVDETGEPAAPVAQNHEDR